MTKSRKFSRIPLSVVPATLPSTQPMCPDNTLRKEISEASKSAVMPGNIAIQAIADYKKIGVGDKYIVLLVKTTAGKKALLLFNRTDSSFSIIRISEPFMRAMMRSTHDPILSRVDMFTVSFSIVDCDGKEYLGKYEAPLQ